MAWLSGLKIKKNVLMEQPPLVDDDAELAAMRRMIMDDAMKRKSMAQRVGIAAYIKNRPQVNTSVVKNVVSNVSSFNRYRSEKDYEEWVVKERERAARLQASRCDGVGELHLNAKSKASEARLHDSDEDSSDYCGGKQLRDYRDEESDLKRQVIERLRNARGDDSGPAPAHFERSRSHAQLNHDSESHSSDDHVDAGDAGAKGKDSRSHNRHRDSERPRHGHAISDARGRDRDRQPSKHRDDRERERVYEGERSDKRREEKDRSATRKSSDHHGGKDRHHGDDDRHRDARDKDRRRKERRRDRDSDEDKAHARGHERRSDDRGRGTRGEERVDR
jgi:hypothetical protein